MAVAVVITWIANYYIFPNTAIREFKNSIKELFQVDRKMIVELKKGMRIEEISIISDIFCWKQICLVMR